jgi:hypothetical protein
MGREPGLPPPSATAHGIQFCAPTHRVTVIPDFAQNGGDARRPPTSPITQRGMGFEPGVAPDRRFRAADAGRIAQWH